jgi:hypothetical protein
MVSNSLSPVRRAAIKIASKIGGSVVTTTIVFWDAVDHHLPPNLRLFVRQNGWKWQWMTSTKCKKDGFAVRNRP